jgi:dolichol-phosphate mannosyltransferase
MKTLIIIPTYNEKENIGRLLSTLQANEVNPDVLIVDDNSPDGTGDIVREIAGRNPRVNLLSREGKKGLGSAYIAGFQYALKNRYDYIFEMDADFSHSPLYLKDFMTEINNYDFVIGSRYVRGGKIEGWNMLRYLISYGGNLLARIILGGKIKDMTGGFRCYRRSVIESIDLETVLSEGYFFQVEVLYRILLQENFKGKEIPIVFENRSEGTSKMSGSIVKEALKNLWMIRKLRKEIPAAH